MRYPFGKEIQLDAGKHTVKIMCMNIEAFPAIYIDSEYLKTDESWIASPFALEKNAGYCDELSNHKQNPLKFPFSYKKIYSKSTEKIKRNIMFDFWKEDKGTFIDCATSGLEHISRHPNILAVLFDMLPKSKVEKIVKNIFENDSITKITTPYFVFFELCAMCKTGNIEFAQNMIDSYWGGMIDLGATTIWEAYDPQNKGIRHYQMYDFKYDKSLCHAWGAGPIYLLGRFCLGVYPTSVGYKTFEVKPVLGKYPFLRGLCRYPMVRAFLFITTEKQHGQKLMPKVEHS